MSGIRHSIKTRKLVMELREGGWSYRKIRKILAKRGVDPTPSVNTIMRWCDPEVDERQRRYLTEVRSRERAAAASFRPSGASRTVQWRMGRIRALDAEVGLGPGVIARIMSYDYPDAPLTREQVRGILEEDRVPHPYRRLAA